MSTFNEDRLQSKIDELLRERGVMESLVHEQQAQMRNLKQEIDLWKDDFRFYDTACRYCLMPEVEAAWRHDHNGDGEFHWRHRLDPGDGLVSDCANSHLFEEVWALAVLEQQLLLVRDA